jgi:phage baseplate assembly protein W
MARGPVFELAIALPFSIDDFGSIATTTSQPKIWADRVRSAVGTALSERVFRENYGTTIPSKLWDSVDTMSEVIEEQIETAFTRDLENLTLDEVEVVYDDRKETIFAEISYFLPNNEQTSITIGVATVSPTEPIVEELL